MPARSTFCGIMAAIVILAFAANFVGAQDLQKSESAEKASAETTPEPQKRQQTIERAVEFITKDGAKWRTEHGCVSCHHGAMTVWALSEAKSQGYVVDGQALEDAVWQTKSAILPVLSRPRDPRPPPWNVVNYPALYLGVMSQNLPILSRDEIHRLGVHIARHQEEDGGWLTRPPTGSGVPPTSESRETISLLALLAWEPQVSAGSQEAAAARDSREKALRWLSETKSTETAQAIALRLVLDARMGMSGDKLQPSIDRLLGLQRADGGWAQLPEMSSDAYATGQSLWALSFANIQQDRPEVVRAASFLVAGQRANGSWPMPFRFHPGDDTTRERDPVPITYFGAAWATLGLVRTVPPILDPAVRQKQSIAAIVAINGKIGRNEGDPEKPVTSADIGWGAYDDNDLAQMVARLTAFPQLTTLKIRYSKLTDAGVVHLKKLPALRNLSLETSAITDAGLAQLTNLTHLETLNLKGTQVTDAGVQAFQKAMPKTKVER